MPPVARAFFVFFALALATLLLGRGTRPPSPLPVSAPAAEFSAERAVQEIERLAATPRRMGSVAHDEAARAIARRCEALGLTTETQETTVLQLRYAATPYGQAPRLATVRNVVARLRGTRPETKAILLMAHYDTRSMTPGASDDGFGVAALLEAARALRAGPPPARDVIFLFSDGEEVGLLGAKAFVEGHPWVGDVEVVLNFDARGDAGPVWLVQTSADNGALVAEIAHAADLPVGSSLSQAVYRRMPNDTDLTEWLWTGVVALSFANIEGYGRYHAPTDTPANLDVATLQHHGAYALSLARRFANGATPPPSPDAIYFNVGPYFVHYPARWTLPIALFALAILAVMLGLGVRRHALTWRGTLFGLVVAAITPLAAGLVAGALWYVTKELRADLALLPSIQPAVKALYFAASVAFGIGTVAMLHAATPRLTLADRFAGVGLVWAFLVLYVSIKIPAGAYLIQWPLIAAAGAGCVIFAAGDGARGRLVGDLAAVSSAGVVVLFIAPVVWLLFVIFGPASAAGIGAAVALAVSLLTPAMETMLAPARRGLALVPAAAGVVSYIAAAFVPSFTAAYPRPDTLFFAIDADHQKAFWASPDPTPDAWTSRVLDGKTRSSLDEFFAGGSGWRFLTHEVAAPDGPPAELTVVHEAAAGDGRDLALRLVPPPGTELLAVQVDAEAKIESGEVEGRDVQPREGGGWSFVYSAPPAQGIAMHVRTAHTGSVTFRVVTQSGGFPEGIAGPGPRPQRLMAKPGVLPPYGELSESDMTLKMKSIVR